MEFQSFDSLVGKQDPAEYQLMHTVGEMMRIFTMMNGPVLKGVLGHNPCAVLSIKLYYDQIDQSLAIRVGYEPQDTRVDGVM